MASSLSTPSRPAAKLPAAAGVAGERFAPSQKFREMQAQCPDLPDAWHHAQPAALARNAGVAAGVKCVRTLAGLLYEYLVLMEGAAVRDEADRAVLQERFNHIVGETLANAPRGLAFAVVRDFVVRSFRSTLQSAAAYYASVPVCRSLTTNIRAELKRIDDAPAQAEEPSVGSVVKMAAVASLITHASVLVVDTSLDVYRAYASATGNGGGNDDDDDDDDDHHHHLDVLDGDLEDSPPDPRRGEAARARLAESTVRRVLWVAGSLVVQSVLVGLAYKTKLDGKWATTMVKLFAL